MCGEQIMRRLGRPCACGSPPRVRGAGTMCGSITAWARITPACAGSSKGSLPNATNTRDHPRVCGEQVHSVVLGFDEQGSPPRVRGAVAHLLPGIVNNRITPACAGSSRGPYAVLDSGKDHPRVCGEQLYFPAFVCTSAGSPPRVRGAAGADGAR